MSLQVSPGPSKNVLQAMGREEEGGRRAGGGVQTILCCSWHSTAGADGKSVQVSQVIALEFDHWLPKQRRVTAVDRFSKGDISKLTTRLEVEARSRKLLKGGGSRRKSAGGAGEGEPGSETQFLTEAIFQVREFYELLGTSLL